MAGPHVNIIFFKEVLLRLTKYARLLCSWTNFILIWNICTVSLLQNNNIIVYCKYTWVILLFIYYILLHFKSLIFCTFFYFLLPFAKIKFILSANSEWGIRIRIIFLGGPDSDLDTTIIIWENCHRKVKESRIKYLKICFLFNAFFNLWLICLKKKNFFSS